MKQQAQDSQWEGFEHQPEPRLQQTLQPFLLPSLSKTLNPTIQVLEDPKPCIQEKQETTETQTTKEKKLTISFTKNYPRIPILKSKQDFSKKNEGVLIYQGFQPSFSDRYFRLPLEDAATAPLLNRDNLNFDSKFESGNLNRVYKNRTGAYDLYMRVDTNTQGHLQWFYFKVRNEKPQSATFTIFRFKKKISLYQRGMRPYVKSKKDGTGWRQTGYNIKYSGTEEEGKSKYYSLTFQYNFGYDNDEVYFAACPPYSYTLLTNRLKQFSTSDRCEVSDIGETLGGLSLPLVTFGSQSCKNYIVVSARTHPGETSGSWVMDGMMSYLFSEKAEEMLKRVTFKIVPMLNPDGVLIGNYRTGILGKDFNRCFNEAPSNLMPEVSQLKSLIKNLQKNGKVLLYLDLHGHSIQRNSFIFGPQLPTFPHYFKEIIPDMQSLSTLFKQRSCKLKTRPECVETARGYFQNVRKIFSLTIQNSLGLYESHSHTYPILTDKWRLFGKEVCQVMQKCILTEFGEEEVGGDLPRAEIKIATSQLQILNKKIIDKIERRIFTEKSDPKDREKERQQEKEKDKEKQKQKERISNNKFLNKKRFQMMKWKKITQIRNECMDQTKQLLSISKKSRKLSEQIKVSELMLREEAQVQIAESHTTKNNLRRPKPLTQEKRESGVMKRENKARFGEDLNLYFSMREVNQSQLSRLKEKEEDIKEIDIQVQSPLLRPRMESIKPTPRPQHPQHPSPHKTIQADNISDEQSESSDINDRENDSDDLQPQQIKSLFHTVHLINKNRVFEFQQEIQEKRVNKLKEVIQKRMIKQPSFHSVPQKMEVYNKYNELKLSLGNKSEASQGRKAFDEEKEMVAIKQRHRRTFAQHQTDPFSAPSHPSTQLPILQQNTSSLLRNKDQPKDLKRPLIIPISRTPISNIYRGNIIQHSIKEQILIQTTKRLEKLQHQSIFSSKPFQDTFIRNKSKHLELKRKLG